MNLIVPTDPLLWQILLQIVLIALNAVFACAEIAVISMNDSRLALLVQQGDKRALRLEKLTSQPARFLATIQVAITLSGFLGSAFAADNFSDRLTGWLVTLYPALPAETVNAAMVIVITLILSYFTLVFGELVPKRLAQKKAEQLALAMSGLITFVSRVFKPLVSLLTLSTNGILRLLGIDPNAEEESVSEEEIRMMVDVGSRKGVIDAEEKELIQNIFEFDDLAVGEFATHRTEVSLLWMEESDEAWEHTIAESRHSMYPVCDESVDNVIGILRAKEYFRLKDRSRANVMEKCVRPARFVPEGLTANILFRQMQRTRNHFAVVLDEYGGTMGIVTMNDLLEQLVGDLEDDETELPPPAPIEQLDSQTWKIRGEALLEDVAAKLGVDLPIEEFDTFGGFVFSAYGSVPGDGAAFEVDTHGLHIRVLEVMDHRLVKSVVCRDKTACPCEEAEA